MALFFIQPPVAATEALVAAMPRIAGLSSVAARGPLIAAAARNFADRTVSATRVPTTVADVVANVGTTVGVNVGAAVGAPMPSPVYIAGLQDLVGDGGDVRKAPLTVWTHLLLDGANTTPVALADVDARTMTFAAMTEGDQVRSIGQNIHDAAADGTGADYDLAMIRVPALYLSAVWLKGRNGAPDVLIPSESPKSPLTPGKRYSPEEFNAALKTVAEQELRETDPLKGG